MLDFLVGNGVHVLLDVRAIAASRRAGFSKTLLAASASARGIGYVHDRALGTPKAGRDAARAGRTEEMRRIFAGHMDEPAAQAGLEAATARAAGQRVCLLCFEREAHRCHRSMVAEMIAARTGQRIVHL